MCNEYLDGGKFYWEYFQKKINLRTYTKCIKKVFTNNNDIPLPL
jgi:hypothetical protein